MYDPLSTMPLAIFSSHDDFSYVSIFPFCVIYPCHLSLMSPCFTPAVILPSSSIFFHDKIEHALRDRACVHVARPKAYSDLSSCSFFIVIVAQEPRGYHRNMGEKTVDLISIR